MCKDSVRWLDMSDGFCSCPRSWTTEAPEPQVSCKRWWSSLGRAPDDGTTNNTAELERDRWGQVWRGRAAESGARAAAHVSGACGGRLTELDRRVEREARTRRGRNRGTGCHERQECGTSERKRRSKRLEMKLCGSKQRVLLDGTLAAKVRTFILDQAADSVDQREAARCRTSARGLPGVEKGSLIEIVKDVFGLPDSPRGWWKELRDTLQGDLWDPAFFCLRDFSGHLIGMIVVHVDDMLFGNERQPPSRISHFSPSQKIRHHRLQEGRQQ